MHLLRNTKLVMTITQPVQRNDGRRLADDIGRAIDWHSSVLEHSICGKTEGRRAENDIVNLPPHPHGIDLYSQDSEDLRALRDWVKAKWIHKRRTEPVAIGFPAPPWHCG
jgi:hypothetical protein